MLDSVLRTESSLREDDLYPTRKGEEEIIGRHCPVVYAKAPSKSPHALSETQLKLYEENGFLVIPDAFSKDEIRALFDEYVALSRKDEFYDRDEYVMEPGSDEVRSIFNPHDFSILMDRLSRDQRIVDKVRQILDSEVYIHHGRINIKKPLSGKSFAWHSDFETWHAEDGLPRMRTVSAWVMLTDNTIFNGPLFLIPGSHKHFVACASEAPEDNFKRSLRKQEYGVPSKEALDQLMGQRELAAALGHAGTLVLHESNVMHGSSDNMSTDARTNLFFVYNSVENKPVSTPYAARKKRPEFLANKNFTPLASVKNAFR